MNTHLPQLIADRLAAAVQQVLGSAVVFDPGWVRPCNDPKFGDYQFNGALALAKSVGGNPRDIATALVKAVNLDAECAPPEIAGPGFLNLRLRPTFVARYLQDIPPAPGDGVDRLGIAAVSAPATVVVDMSSPNLAKEMHVGHLRSTVIGESIARLLAFAGHRVEKVNHVGDWGTQFGMLVAHLRATRPDILDNPEHLAISDLESFYVAAKGHFDADAAFAEEARRTVVALQGGDPATLTIWRAFCAESLRHCHAVYDLLGIDNLLDRGESFYNDQLAGTLDELAGLGLIEKSEGAECIFLDGFKSRTGEPLPMMVRKSDGGYNYAATDLTALRYRRRQTGATRLIYVVGAPQKHHLAMLFAAADRAGWLDGATAEHIAFGSMLGQDGKPFKTRAGGTVKLKDLLEEAVVKARATLEASYADDAEHTLSAADMERIARTVGLAAVRYYDLSHNLATDYRFDWDQMLAMEGNTAPYMLYAYARIRSIGRKAGVDLANLPADAPIILETEVELALAKTLVRFPELIDQLTRELRPNVLTDYLYALSKAFSRFYDRKIGVRVVDAETDALRDSRLRLCDLTARVIRTGLHLLGIETLEQM